MAHRSHHYRKETTRPFNARNPLAYPRFVKRSSRYWDLVQVNRQSRIKVSG